MRTGERKTKNEDWGKGKWNEKLKIGNHFFSTLCLLCRMDICQTSTLSFKKVQRQNLRNEINKLMTGNERSDTWHLRNVFVYHIAHRKQ